MEKDPPLEALRVVAHTVTEDEIIYKCPFYGHTFNTEITQNLGKIRVFRAKI